MNTSIQFEVSEQDGTRQIDINGIIIKTIKKPILNMEELERYSSNPLPEMLFGNNSLTIKTPNFGICFNAADALSMVEFDDSVKVAIAQEWTRKSQQHHSNITRLKPYDWTFTTKYRGTSDSNFIPSDKQINTSLLLLPEKILFYDQLVLYEDELGDNGCAILSLRVVSSH